MEKEELEVRKMKEEVTIKNARKEEKLAVAKKLKEIGLNDENIRKSTGLGLSIIKKL